MKKRTLLGLSAILALVALALVFPGAKVDAGTRTKSDRAAQLWKMSGHADKTGEPFNHWNTASPAVIPTTCAKCHSTPGFLDFLGADGTAPGQVDNSAPIGTTVECQVCHSDPKKGVLRVHSSVLFPSGFVVNNLGPEGLCMECHQGRASTATVDASIAAAAAATDDTPSAKIKFSNVHYYAAAATQFGTFAKSGYEYAGKPYDARFSHITGYNACNNCHNPHSLKVDITQCNTCHTGVTDFKDIRFVGSQVDYDGSGDLTKGMFYVIDGIKAKLLATIQNYAATVVKKPIGYDGATNPYWFYDTNGDGVISGDENASTNGYASFTNRLTKACYNYQVATKDPNGFAHNGKYLIELLYDSIEDLNVKLAQKTDLSAMNRTDEGHFDGSSPAFRHWDSGGQVDSGCAKCHSATGLAYYLANGTNQAEPLSNGMLCTTCHTAPPAVRPVPTVKFPSGLSVTLGDNSNNCISCHQGRESKSSVDAAIAANPSGTFSFKNVHYFAAGATFLGTEVQVGYEFPGKVYTGRQPFANHGGRFNTCVECHMSTAVVAENHNWTMRTHNVAEPMKENCVPCHGNDISQTNKGADPEKFDFEQIRPGNIPDYNGNGNTRESLKEEIQGLEAALYAQIQAYSLSAQGARAVYDGNTNPYWFKDTNNNGIADPAEETSANGYKFNAAGLRAAFNYQLSKKEPHGFIHNARYVAQLLVDSIQSLGGDVSMYTWR
jgi:hypothetical protein